MVDEKILKDAQYRKGLSIAFFNATNAAISLVGNFISPAIDTDPDFELVKKEVVKIRDFFLEEHKKYYAAVIANVGLNYKVEDSIKKLNSSKSLVQLNENWRLLSEDERRDEQVIKVAQKLKKFYEEA